MISESEFTVKAHGVHTAYVEMTKALKKRDDVDVEVNVARENADIMHVQTIGLFSLVKMRKTKAKIIISGHIVPDSLVGSLRGAKLWYGLASLYLRWFYNKADVVIAVSEETKQALKNLGVIKPIVVIHNMVDTYYYSVRSNNLDKLRSELKITKDKWVVVSNGQVQPRKRVDVFINLARKMPDTKFIWIGGIPFKGLAAEYEKMKKIMNSAPSNVIFTGVIPLESVRDYFQLANAFIMPSDQETFGLAIVEAAAAGLPVVLRDMADYDNTFRNDAIMCAEQDFEKALLRLRYDKDYRESAIRSSKELASKYDSSNICEKLIKVYKSLL